MLDRRRLLRFVAILFLFAFAAENRSAAADPAAKQEPVKQEPSGQTAGAGHREWLTDLPATDVHVGYGKFGKNGWTGFGGGQVRLNDIPSPHGLGTHPNSSVSFLLAKKYRSFRAAAAVNDSTNGFWRPVLFIVEADGKEIWRSWGLQYAHDCQAIALDVTGVNRLTLRTKYDPNRKGNGNWAHVVWLEPYVSTAPCDPALVAGLRTDKIYPPWTFQAFESDVSQMLYNQKFDDLESLAKKCRSEHEMLEGASRIHCFYDALAAPRSNEQQKTERLGLLDQWHKAKPESAIPQIASAEIWLDLARSVLEGGTRAPGEEGLRLANERVGRASDFISDAEQSGSQDPELYGPYITMAAMEDRPTEKIDGLLEEALRIDPHYASAYKARAATLLPRRGGKPGDIEHLASAIRARLGGREGEIAYARIVLVSLVADSKLYGTEFKREQIRPAFVAYCHDYAASRPLVQQMCYIACMAGDFETARAIFDQIPAGDAIDELWKNAQKMEEWRSKVDASSAHNP